MSTRVEHSAQIEVCSGARPSLKQLRATLTKLARIVPASALIEIERYQYPKPESGRTPFWYVRAIARWGEYI